MSSSVTSLLERLKDLQQSAGPEFRSADSLQALQSLNTKYLGKKGLVSEILKGLKDVDGKDRPKVGQAANKLRDELGEIIGSCNEALENAAIDAKVQAERVDVTLPGRRKSIGSVHPLQQVRDRIVGVFTSLGFSVVSGPEVETEFCNFEALNVPADHPARDMQDTLYVRPGIVLRTQTSSVQIRTMLSQKPPIKIVAPGAVFRNDDVDATHSPMFHQVEGLYVDEHVTMEELKGTLLYFAKKLFGEKTEVRFRSSFFPFTEPSVEVDCTCVFCKGKGCRICKQSGWIEILGAGMVHPSLFEKVGYAKETKLRGFAFGVGIDRVAMLLYGIDDIRLFFENDLRFLEQFH